jgi:hypothetical protein
MKDRKVKQVPSRSEYQWGGGKEDERGKEGESGGCALYSHMKIEE